MDNLNLLRIQLSYCFWGCILIFSFCLPAGFVFAASTELNAPSQKHNVLLLNSYNKGYGWTDNQVQAIEDIFPVTGDTILRIEYMDTKMINTSDYYQVLRDLYIYKYKDIKFDAIISTDDDALRFLRKYRDELFPGVPVIFSGINSYNPSKVSGFKLFTGVNEEADYKGSLNLLLKLHPDTSRV